MCRLKDGGEVAEHFASGIEGFASHKSPVSKKPATLHNPRKFLHQPKSDRHA